MTRLTPVACLAVVLASTACTGASDPAPAPPQPAPTSASQTLLNRPAPSWLTVFVENALDDRSRPWTEQEERRPTEDVVMYRGAEHCDWGQAVFLNVGWPLGRSAGDALEDPDRTRQFLRDPGGAYTGETAGELDLDATMPSDAVDTGYHNGAVSLWLADSDPDAAYLTDGVATERWPRVPDPFGCR